MSITEKIAINAVTFGKLKGIQIYDIEQAAGVSRGYLSRLKKEKNRMNVETAYAIAKFLDVSIEDLFTGKSIKEYRIAELEAEIERIRSEGE